MMIEFNGPITEENQLNRMKKVDKTVLYVFFGGLILIWIIVIVFELIFSDVLQELWKECVVCSAIMLGIIFLSVNPPQKSSFTFPNFSTYYYYGKRPFFRIAEQWKRRDRKSVV